MMMRSVAAGEVNAENRRTLRPWGGALAALEDTLTRLRESERVGELHNPWREYCTKGIGEAMTFTPVAAGFVAVLVTF
jgi:hypothetical protein